MTVDLASLTQYGPLGIMLVVFIWLHWRSLQAAEKREAAWQAREESLRAEQATQDQARRAELAAARAECKSENDALRARITTLEDQARDEHREMLTSCMRTMETCAIAVRRWTEHETGRHPALEPPA